MSLFDYRTSLNLAAQDHPFYALIMAAMRKADSNNIAILKNSFPEIWNELQQRYDSPGGILPEEKS